VNTTHGAIYLYWTNGYQELHRLVPLVGGKVSHAILEPDHSGNHYQAAFTPDGCYVMCGSASGDIHVWDTRDGRAVVKYVGHTAPSLVIQCNPRWALFASACKDVVSICAFTTMLNQLNQSFHKAIWTPTEEAIASCSAA
jgi:WD40 repeat protein